MISELETKILNEIVNKLMNDKDNLQDILNKIYAEYGVINEQYKEHMIQLINDKLSA